MARDEDCHFLVAGSHVRQGVPVPEHPTAGVGPFDFENDQGGSHEMAGKQRGGFRQLTPPERPLAVAVPVDGPERRRESISRGASSGPPCPSRFSTSANRPPCTRPAFPGDRRIESVVRASKSEFRLARAARRARPEPAPRLGDFVAGQDPGLAGAGATRFRRRIQPHTRPAPARAIHRSPDGHNPRRRGAELCPTRPAPGCARNRCGRPASGSDAAAAGPPRDPSRRSR